MVSRKQDKTIVFCNNELKMFLAMLDKQRQECENMYSDDFLLSCSDDVPFSPFFTDFCEEISPRNNSICFLLNKLNTLIKLENKITDICDDVYSLVCDLTEESTHNDLADASNNSSFQPSTKSRKSSGQLDNLIFMKRYTDVTKYAVEQSCKRVAFLRKLLIQKSRYSSSGDDSCGEKTSRRRREIDELFEEICEVYPHFQREVSLVSRTVSAMIQDCNSSDGDDLMIAVVSTTTSSSTSNSKTTIMNPKKSLDTVVF